MDVYEAWQAFNTLTAISVFFVYIAVDGMYAYYTLAVAREQPMRAATTGALMHFLLAVGVLSYIQNYLYLIPLALGSWIGTYVVMKKSKSATGGNEQG